MALLKKLKAATLMETMVATVLIVVIFMMASMLLNSIFTTYLRGDTQGITEKMHELAYQFHHEKMSIPYAETWQNWEIFMEKEIVQGNPYVVMVATHQTSGKTVTSYCTDED